MRLTCKTCGSRYSCSTAEHDATECTGPPECQSCHQIPCSGSPLCGLYYIARSPKPLYGGFHSETIATANAAIEQIHALEREVEELQAELSAMRARLRTRRRKQTA